jgi:hypothetical protein
LVDADSAASWAALSPSDAGREDDVPVDGAFADGVVVGGVLVGGVLVDGVLVDGGLVGGGVLIGVLVNSVLVNNVLVNDGGRAGTTLEMPLMEHLTDTWWDRHPLSPGHINQWMHGSLKCGDCGERGVRCNRSDDAAGRPSATRIFATLIPLG